MRYAECGKLFGFKSKRKKHIEVVHEKQRNHKCQHCNKTFTESGGLKRHIKSIHVKIKNQKCDRCDKTFDRKHQLHRHLASHENLKYHKCASCFNDLMIKEI